MLTWIADIVLFVIGCMLWVQISLKLCMDMKEGARNLFYRSDGTFLLTHSLFPVVTLWSYACDQIKQQRAV